ncbi:hypothetical protein QQY66_49215 [Streptomyces sp. DG2A-72]|uniref:hypothetical protein n=1 Tax=Streptomyces sp. DG2A-72 TaxID=3051386 RepID=UPI00265C1943|nr:hypothetical protein [Streptomyces sp. DG2A-72]MDO0939295.1 hypothetical protein [Streptomyces sp. DG2A-72]
MVEAHSSHEGNGNDMQGWANTDSNDSLFHAFTGEDGASLRAVCNGRIRPAERHRRRDCGLLTAEAARALPFTTHLCERCAAKADAPAKSTADVIADGAPLYKRAGLRHAAVGRGRRVHYSRGNDDTLCGRALTAYLDLDEAAARYARGDELCTRCMRAAEELAYAKSLAAASPVTRAAAELAEIVADTDEANRRFRDAMDSITRTNNTTSLSELARWTSSLWPHVEQDGAPREFHFLMMWAARTTHLLTLAGIARRAGHLWENAEDAIEGRVFLVDAETRALFADTAPATRPEFGEVLAIVRADEVRPGDTVLGAMREGATVESATPADVVAHPDPYTADPRPYNRACGCGGCQQAEAWTGPVITLAVETPWDACDPLPAAVPVLIRVGRRTSAEEVKAPQAPASTDKRVVCGDGRERVVVGTTNRPGEPARVVVEGGPSGSPPSAVRSAVRPSRAAHPRTPNTRTPSPPSTSSPGRSSPPSPTNTTSPEATTTTGPRTAPSSSRAATGALRCTGSSRAST